MQSLPNSALKQNEVLQDEWNEILRKEVILEQNPKRLCKITDIVSNADYIY